MVPVVVGQDRVQFGTPLGGESLADHHLQQAAQRPYLVGYFLLAPAGQPEGVQPLPRSARPNDSSLGCAGQRSVLPLGVDDVVGHALEEGPQGEKLDGIGLARAGLGHHHGVGVQESVLVERIENHGTPAPDVDAEGDPLSGVQVWWGEGKQADKGGRVDPLPVARRIAGQG